jgi:hypothetical protein
LISLIITFVGLLAHMGLKLKEHLHRATRLA